MGKPMYPSASKDSGYSAVAKGSPVSISIPRYQIPSAIAWPARTLVCNAGMLRKCPSVTALSLQQCH